MNRRAFSRIAASSLIVTSSMVACSGAQMEHRPAIASAQASGISVGIERALGAKDFARALLEAERLVEAQPREASARTLLGRAYLANGRFQSARTAFEDAMTLGANDPRTLISLSLIRTGLGDAEGARALLSDHISDLPAADYGLAMAMAGNPNEGVRALMEAYHQPDADAKTRQNLAYAMALSGNWGQARLVAGQDLNGKALQDRMTQWAATATPEAAPQRIAALIGVSPRGDDGGLPARLALSNSEPTSLAAAAPTRDLIASAVADVPAEHQPQQVAEAEPVALPAPVPTPVAVTEPTPQAVTAAFAEAAPVPVIRASSDPMREAVRKRLVEPAAPTANLAARDPAPAVATAAVAKLPHGGSDWVVQIGAYNNSRVAADGWKRAKGKSLEQRGYHKVTGTIAINGRTFYRLAMSGFGDRAQAAALCSSLRAQGQSCFVRRDEGVANDIRMAKLGRPLKVASR